MKSENYRNFIRENLSRIDLGKQPLEKDLTV